jgi:hypothetical protein
MPSRISCTLTHVSPWNPTNFYALNASGSSQRHVGDFRSALETTALGYYNYLKMIAAAAHLMQLQSSEKAWFRKIGRHAIAAPKSSEQSFTETKKGTARAVPFLDRNRYGVTFPK